MAASLNLASTSMQWRHLTRPYPCRCSLRVLCSAKLLCDGGEFANTTHHYCYPQCKGEERFIVQHMCVSPSVLFGYVLKTGTDSLLKRFATELANALLPLGASSLISIGRAGGVDPLLCNFPSFAHLHGATNSVYQNAQLIC